MYFHSFNQAVKQFDNELNSNLYHFRSGFYFYFCSESNSDFILREVLWTSSFMPPLANLHNYILGLSMTLYLILHFMDFLEWNHFRQSSIF